MKPMEFLERLKDSALGRKIISEAERDARIPVDRAGWAAEYAAVSKEREERIYDLVAEEKRITEECIATILRLHREAIAVQMQRYDFDARTGGRMRELERMLRNTADPVLRAGGPLTSRLDEIVRHLMKHNHHTIGRLREVVRDIQENGGPSEREREDFEHFTEVIRLHDACGPLVDRFRAAIRTVDTLALTDSKDVSRDIDALLAKLPKECPCGESLAVLAPVEKPKLVAA